MITTEVPALQTHNPYTYRVPPPAMLYCVFLTTSPLRELMQSTDLLELQALAANINATAVTSEVDPYYRAVVEEYRLMSAEAMQILTVGPQMIDALRTIAAYTREGDMGDMGDEELIDGWGKMTQAAVLALAFVDATVDRDRLTTNFRRSQASGAMLNALLSARTELAEIKAETDAVVSTSVLQQIDEAIAEANGVPGPDPREESDAFHEEAKPVWPDNVVIATNPEAMALAEKEHNPLRWIYMSFAAEQDGFRGAALVQAHGMASAIQAAWALGINPGGSVMTAEIPENELPDPSFRNRLLTKAEVLSIWPDSASLKDLAFTDGERKVPIACAGCNDRAEFADTPTEEFDEEIVGDD